MSKVWSKFSVFNRFVALFLSGVLFRVLFVFVGCCFVIAANVGALFCLSASGVDINLCVGVVLSLGDFPCGCAVSVFAFMFGVLCGEGE